MTTKISMLAIGLAKGSFQDCAVAPEGIPQEPIRLRQATQQRRCASVIGDLSSRHEEPDWAALRISDGM